ncbi:MAG TPA: hypothetical protein VMM83_00925 [Longimicrobiales bacterium]|nr:hypothetical protein [Longimicrobiales bacterium]
MRNRAPSAGATRAATAALALAACLLSAPGALGAQGAGTAGAELLQMSAGARAAALGGAYTAASGDPDAVFYNPAASVWLDAGAGIGYEAYAEDITIGSLSGALDTGPVSLAAGLLFLDAGDISEVVPDPAFGGERGRPTGEDVGATEAAGRVAAAVRLAGGRAAAGAALGFFTSDLAGVSRSTVFADVGAQFRVNERVALGAAIRNIGTGLASEGYGDAPLPAQARIGATIRVPIGSTYGAAAFADGIWGIEEETAGLALGVEAGFLPATGAFTAVVRGGATVGESDGHLGRLRFGGGLSIAGLALDYTVQVFEYLGAVHRAGIRWTR